MQYILGLIAVLIVIGIIFWIGIGILALIGLAFKYISILIAVIVSLRLIYNLVTKKDNNKNIDMKNYGTTMLVCISLFFLSFPILNLTGSVWDWAQEDNDINQNQESTLSEDNQVDKIVDQPIQTKVDNTEGQRVTETVEEDNEVWTKENIVENLNKLNVLNDKGKFTDYKYGSKVYEHDDATDGKTNIQNSHSLHLSIISNEGIKITDKDICSEIVFNIVYELYKHKENMDFDISLVGIKFYNSDGVSKTTGSDWDNFYLGINTINNYFSEVRIDKQGISTLNGSIVKTDFDALSFYKWIEDHFTYPEDLSILAEDTSWTTVSKMSSNLP